MPQGLVRCGCRSTNRRMNILLRFVGFGWQDSESRLDMGIKESCFLGRAVFLGGVGKAYSVFLESCLLGLWSLLGGMCIQRPKKIPDKSKLKKGGFLLAHSVRLQFLRMGKAWRREHEMAAHTTPVLMSPAALLPFFSFSQGLSPGWLFLPQLETSLQTCLQLCFHGDSVFSHTPAPLNPVKLTAKIIHCTCSSQSSCCDSWSLFVWVQLVRIPLFL